MEQQVTKAKAPRKPAEADEIREQQLTRKAALLVAEGVLTDKEIASKLGIQPGTLKTWKTSPLFIEMVRNFADRIVDEGVGSIVDKIMADAPANLSFLKDVRDGVVVDNPKSLSVRLRAAELLFDRQVSKKGAETDGAIKVIIGGRLLGQMVQAMKQDGAAIDVEFDELDDQGQVRGAQTPDEFNARLTRQIESPSDDDEDEDE